MFFELTDYLACPRCGPAFGLVLLVEEVDGRRVRSGWLGCPNCRHDYPVREGVADLRLDPHADPGKPGRFKDAELALKIVALSGMGEDSGCLMVDERLAHSAAEVAALAHQLEVIAVSAWSADATSTAGVSLVLADVRFPLVESRLRCVAIAPGGDSELVAAAARRVAAGGRLLLFDAAESDLEVARRSGLKIVAVEDGTAVAERRVGSLPIVG